MTDKALARNTDPETSHEAAESMVSVAKMEAVVLLAIAEWGPLTWDELAEKTGYRHGTLSPRFKPLRMKKLIEAVGRRPGSSGRAQTVWGLSDFGREKMELWGAKAEYAPGSLQGMAVMKVPAGGVDISSIPTEPGQIIEVNEHQGRGLTIEEWNESGLFPFKVVDPDGFDRKDPHLAQRRFLPKEFLEKAMGSTIVNNEKHQRERLVSTRSEHVSFATGLTVEMVDAVTNDQWDLITDGKGAAMRGFLRKRIKRTIRLLTEGRVYDDPTEDGRTLAAKGKKG